MFSSTYMKESYDAEEFCGNTQGSGKVKKGKCEDKRMHAEDKEKK